VRGNSGKRCRCKQFGVDFKFFNPVTFWSKLKDDYDTTANTLCLVIEQIKKLVTLRLDPDTSANRFVTQWNQCILQLAQSGVQWQWQNVTKHRGHYYL
jgi:hypothetical protein